jgi:rubredoxin
MTCPRCKASRDILDFQRFGEIEEFAQDTAPIYKCPKARGGCGWIFAPAEHTVLHSIHPEYPLDGEGDAE